MLGKRDIDSAFKSLDKIADNLEKIAKSLDDYLNRDNNDKGFKKQFTAQPSELNKSQ